MFVTHSLLFFPSPEMMEAAKRTEMIGKAGEGMFHQLSIISFHFLIISDNHPTRALRLCLWIGHSYASSVWYFEVSEMSCSFMGHLIMLSIFILTILDAHSSQHHSAGVAAMHQDGTEGMI